MSLLTTTLLAALESHQYRRITTVVQLRAGVSIQTYRLVFYSRMERLAEHQRLIRLKSITQFMLTIVVVQ